MLGDNIRRIRKSKKISINKLSSMSGISLGYLSDIENNNAKNPTMDKLQAIADALEVSVSDFLTSEEKLSMTMDSLEVIKNLAKEGLEKHPIKKTLESENKIETLAAHFEGEEFTDEDVEDIENFIKFLLSKKKK